MSAEWVTAAGTIGTFVVIAGSALAALVQLRHMRGSNQIIALTELREALESAAFQAKLQEIYGPFQERLHDDAFLQRIISARRLGGEPDFAAALIVGNFFENAGCLVKHGIIDPEIFCDLWGAVVDGAWSGLEPFITARRHSSGPALYENFEYLAVTAEQFIQQHPAGTYPKGVPRKQRPEAPNPS